MDIKEITEIELMNATMAMAKKQTEEDCRRYERGTRRFPKYVNLNLTSGKKEWKDNCKYNFKENEIQIYEFLKKNFPYNTGEIQEQFDLNYNTDQYTIYCTSKCELQTENIYDLKYRSIEDLYTQHSCLSIIKNNQEIMTYDYFAYENGHFQFQITKFINNEIFFRIPKLKEEFTKQISFHRLPSVSKLFTVWFEKFVDENSILRVEKKDKAVVYVPTSHCIKWYDKETNLWSAYISRTCYTVHSDGVKIMEKQSLPNGDEAQKVYEIVKKIDLEMAEELQTKILKLTDSINEKYNQAEKLKCEQQENVYEIISYVENWTCLEEDELEFIINYLKDSCNFQKQEEKKLKYE